MSYIEDRIINKYGGSFDRHKYGNSGDRKKLPYNTFEVGDTVTCYEEQESYYSNYAGRPVLTFKPGMIGTVGAVRVPYVTYRPGTRPNDSYFLCVDYIDPASGEEERVGLSYRNVKKP